MYDINLKYIAISYRWGEEFKQQVQTPDYTANVTSFHLKDFMTVCKHIKKEPDLKEIQYVWIDAISVDQQNDERKKETILKMNQIYKYATYILAVPDLHWRHLKNIPGNQKEIELIDQYGKKIYQDLLFHLHKDNNKDDHSIVPIYKNEKKKKKFSLLNYFKKEVENDGNDDVYNEKKTVSKEKEGMKNIYQFLAKLVEDWANRTWVISEYQVAKEKYGQLGTPLKYIFVSLLNHNAISSFFSYSFDNDDDHPSKDNEDRNNNNDDMVYISSWEVINKDIFINFLKSKLAQKSLLEMILTSDATLNEDRFYAILPLWDKYKLLVNSNNGSNDNDNKITSWNITDTTSVLLKLYEIINDIKEDGNLWMKARLLYACSHIRKEDVDESINPLPSFAKQYNKESLQLIEMDNIKFARNHYLYTLTRNEMSYDIDDTVINTVRYTVHNKLGNGLPYTENLMDIQYRKMKNHVDDDNYLSVKSKIHYFINHDPSWFKNNYHYDFNQEFLSTYSLENDQETDKLKCVFIPFFIFNSPEDYHILTEDGSGIFLIGNMKKNRWVLLYNIYHKNYSFNNSYSTDDYNFKIY
ncbi:unnamed protein product [Cunninghamella blakesleeana]